jgi:hypothetical protein
MDTTAPDRELSHGPHMNTAMRRQHQGASAGSPFYLIQLDFRIITVYSEFYAGQLMVDSPLGNLVAACD